MREPPHTGDLIALNGAAPERSYPNLSPQLLARVTQLWSAAGIEFDRHWHAAVHSLPGFRAVRRSETSSDSADVDLVFLFDQCVLWVRAVHEAANAGRAHETPGLSPAQWHGLAALSARLTEQLAALRLLALTDLPMPAMQIARSISEDVDMALVLLIRRKLARRFAECRTVEDASDFWRRHIAGGRAFRSISEKLYSVGIDHSADTEYAQWRRSVLATLGAAVHSNALNTRLPTRRQGDVLLNGDSLQFATFRVHEFCAFAQLLDPTLTEALGAAGKAAKAHGATSPSASLAALAAPLSHILIGQVQSLDTFDRRKRHADKPL